MNPRRLVFAALVLLAAAAWWQSSAFGAGAALLPRIAAGVVVALAVAGLVFPGTAALEETPNRRTAAVGVLFVAYAFVMPRLGFVLSTAIVSLALVPGVGGMRPVWRWGAIVLVFLAVVYLVFTQLFYIRFPEGIAR